MLLFPWKQRNKYLELCNTFHQNSSKNVLESVSVNVSPPVLWMKALCSRLELLHRRQGETVHSTSRTLLVFTILYKELIASGALCPVQTISVRLQENPNEMCDSSDIWTFAIGLGLFFSQSIILYRSILATCQTISPWTQNDLFRDGRKQRMKYTWNFGKKNHIYFVQIIWSIFSLPLGRNLSMLPDSFYLRHPICLYLLFGVREGNLIKLSRYSFFFF